jgi:hypothetical protein
MADSEGSAATVLDRLVPTFQAVERQSATIAASADHVWAALSQVTVGELRLFRLLMGLRVLPRTAPRPPPCPLRCRRAAAGLGGSVRLHHPR